MANICEVCGKFEGEETDSTQLMVETLHVCEDCRNDRQHPSGAAAPSVEG